MQIGICAGPEAFAARPEDLDFIEGHVRNMLAPESSEEEFASFLTAMAGSPVAMPAANCFLPKKLKTTGDEVDSAAIDAYVRTAMTRAAKAGIEIIVFGSGGSRAVPEGFDHDKAFEQLVGHLKRWAPIAADNGVTIVVEPLHKAACNIITTVAEGAELVRRADHPGVRLLVDTYHMACDNDPVESIRAAGDLIAHAHTAEVQDRACPGTHGEDLRPYFKALKAGGYNGRVAIECSWQDMPGQLAGALAALRRQIDEA